MMPSNLILLGFFLLPVLLLGGYFATLRRARLRGDSRTGVLLANLLLFLGLCSLVLAPGEIYYRFVHDGTDGYDLDLVTNRWIERHYEMNNFGIRDDVNYADRIEPGKRRLTVLGDSYANGHGVADVAERYVNRLRRARPDWEVHLLAVDGLDTGALLEGLEQRAAAGYELDRVLYAYCLNDISDLVPAWQAAARRVYHERLGPLLSNSYLLNTYYYRFKVFFDEDLRHYYDWILEAHAGPEWSEQAERLVELQQTVDRHGGRLSVASFPFFESMDDPRFRAIHEQLDRFWADRGVAHLDLLPLYADYPPAALIVNRYDTHPSVEAHALAAQWLESFLTEEEAAPDSSPNTPSDEREPPK
jgi:SAM-dependent methyltransferase